MTGSMALVVILWQFFTPVRRRNISSNIKGSSIGLLGLTIYSPWTMATSLHFKQSSQSPGWLIYSVIGLLGFILAGVWIYVYWKNSARDRDSLIKIKSTQRLNGKLTATIIAYRRQQWMVVDNGHGIALKEIKGQPHV